VKSLIIELKAAIVATLVLAVILCGVYPLAVLVVAQGFFPSQANGSLLTGGGTVIGSSLLGQPFTEPRYFHPRPSAAGAGYDATASGGSNLGPTSRKLVETVRDRVAQYRSENGLAADAVVPADAVTASASGLDPDISVKNALLQAGRVAKARGMKESTVGDLLRQHMQGRTFGVLGEPRVNVLQLNLSLDKSEKNGK
jgi:potassium-transporting ATPase KdpC subunit